MIRLGVAALTLSIGWSLAACQTALPDAAPSVDAEVRSRAALDSDVRLGERTRIEALLADGLGLDDALRIALVRNAALLAEYEDLNIARAEVVQAGLPANPSLDTAVRFVESGGGHIVEAALVQPLVSSILAPQRSAIARAEVCAVRARLVALALDVLGEVRRAWYALVAAEQMVELHRTATLAARAASEAAAEIRRAGNTPALDAAREKAFYEEQRSVLAKAQIRAYAARESLNELLGLGGSLTTWTVAGRLPVLPEESGMPPEVEQRAVGVSQDLAHRRAEVVALGRSLGLTHVESVVREVAVGVEGEREADGEWSVGPVIALEIPLFDHGQGAVPRARAMLRAAMLRYVAEGVRVKTRARVEAQRTGAAWRQARHARDTLLPLRQQVLQETLKQSNAMQVGVFHVIEAKRELIQAGEHYVESLYRYWDSRSRTDQILAGSLPRTAESEGD